MEFCKLPRHKYPVLNHNSPGYLRNILTFYAAVCVGTIALLVPVLYNGYPIINPDDNTYLCSGFLPETPFDRPITYGLILRLTSLNGLSLFFSAFLQCWLVSWLAVKCTRAVTGITIYWGISVLTTIALSFCTSLSWISSELLPDVYTPIALLCLALILLQKETKATVVLLFILYTTAVATHMSHVPVFFILLLLALFARKKIFPELLRRKATGHICVAMFLTLAAIATMGSALSKSRHVFGVAALLEQGILKPYLEENCTTKNYKLCAYKDKLGTDANIFLWSSNSPLYATGGWAANKKEFNDILSGTITQPRFLAMRIKMSALFSFKQAITFNVGDGNFSVDTPLYTTVAQYLPNDAEAFRRSRQHESRLLQVLGIPNSVINITVLLSVLLLLLFAISPGNLNREFLLFSFLAISLVIVNIWVCATFGQVNGRYGCRVMWLVPFCAILALLQRFNNKHQLQNNSLVG